MIFPRKRRMMKPKKRFEAKRPVHRLKNRGYSDNLPTLIQSAMATPARFIFAGTMI